MKLEVGYLDSQIPPLVSIKISLEVVSPLASISNQVFTLRFYKLYKLLKELFCQTDIS